VHHQRPHCQINFIRLFVACFQIISKFVVDSTTKKPREVQFFFLDSVTVNIVVQTESEACQKQWLAGRGDLKFWGEDDGPTVVVWESLSESEQEQWSKKMGKSKD